MVAMNKIKHMPQETLATIMYLAGRYVYTPTNTCEIPTEKCSEDIQADQNIFSKQVIKDHVQGFYCGNNSLAAGEYYASEQDAINNTPTLLTDAQVLDNYPSSKSVKDCADEFKVNRENRRRCQDIPEADLRSVE